MFLFQSMLKAGDLVTFDAGQMLLLMIMSETGCFALSRHRLCACIQIPARRKSVYILPLSNVDQSIRAIFCLSTCSTREGVQKAAELVQVYFSHLAEKYMSISPIRAFRVVVPSVMWSDVPNSLTSLILSNSSLHTGIA